MIVLIGGEKGGTGKTTTSTNLAVMRVARTPDLLLIDGDPQPNASYWCMVRDSREVKPRIASVQKTGKSLRNEVIALHEKYTDIIIDTGGRDTPELRAGMLVADVCLIPLRPSQFDLWTLAKINDLVGEIKQVNDKLRVIICLNQAPTNPALCKEIEDAKIFFTESGLDNVRLAETVVHERVVFRKAATNGLSVHELGMDVKAEAELDSLYKEVFNGQ
jgi:chromosome partitioning protein